MLGSNSKGLEIARPFLQCCAYNRELAARGAKGILHKQQISYYCELLCPTAIGGMLPALEDASVDQMLALQDATPEEPAPEELVDGVQEPEGEPDQQMEGKTEFGVDRTSTHHFGPCTCQHQLLKHTNRAGLQRTEHRWRLRCPFHIDEGDPAGTECSKSKAFTQPLKSRFWTF